MNRYRLGFLIFGPPEQCDDGEFIKYEDHKKTVSAVQDKYLEMIQDLSEEYDNSITCWSESSSEWRDKCWKVEDELTEEKKAHKITRAINWILCAAVIIEITLHFIK